MNVHYRFNNSPRRALILCQMNPDQGPSHAIYLNSISILFPHLFLCLPSCLFSSDFPMEPYTPYSCPSPMLHVHPNYKVLTPQYNDTVMPRQTQLLSFPAEVPSKESPNCCPAVSTQLPALLCDSGWAEISWRDTTECNSGVSEFARCHHKTKFLRERSGTAVVACSGSLGTIQSRRLTAVRSWDRLTETGKV